MPTSVPGPTPRLRSRCATRFARSFELPKVSRSPSNDDGVRVRRAPRPVFEQILDEPVLRKRSAGAFDQPMRIRLALFVEEHRQPRDRPVRVGGDRLERASRSGAACRTAVDASNSSVLYSQVVLRPVVPLAHAEQEVELRPPLLVHELRRRRCLCGSNFGRFRSQSGLCKHHHHLEDGRLAQVALGVRRPHDHLVRDVGVGECPSVVSRARASSSRKDGSPDRSIAQRERVDEVADHRLELACGCGRRTACR